MNVSIVGLGYVGTVSAACLACKGHHVWGVDIDPDKVNIINEGRSPIVEDGLEDRVGRARRVGSLQATTNIQQALRQSELCLVAVATPSRPNGQIDSSHLLAACEQIALALAQLQRHQILVVRSSIMPWVLESCLGVFQRIAPGLVKISVNPEFLREGSAISDFEKPPFTLLGVDDSSVEAALRSLYGDIVAPVFVLPPKEALMVKYASNTYHALKATFANEIGALCDRADVDAGTVMSVFCRDTKLNISDRYLMPGFAFGGSCLPKDVRAVSYAAKQFDLEVPLLNSLLTSNERVIERAVHDVIASGARYVGLIGLSFKSNTDDLRESPFVELAERLIGKGYELDIYDPNVSLARLMGANKEYISRRIPHLSRLLVCSLDDLEKCDLLLVGHRYPGVNAFLDRTSLPVQELCGSVQVRARGAEVAA